MGASMKITLLGTDLHKHKKRHWAFVAAAVTALVVAAPTAIALQPKSDIEETMDRASSYLDQVEQRLDRIRPTTSENSVRGIKRQFDRAQKAIDAIPDGEPGKADILSRMGALEERYDQALVKFEAAEAVKEEHLAQLAEWDAAGKLKSDEEFLSVAIDTARWMKFMDINAAALSKDDQLADEYARYAASFPPAYTRVSEIARDYKGMDPVDVRSSGGGSNLQLFLQEGEYQGIFDQAWANLEMFSAPAVDRGNALLDEAIASARTSLDSGRPGDLVGNKQILGVQHYIDSISKVYGARPDKDPTIVTAYDALNTKLDDDLGGVIREAFQEIVAENDPVANRFRDADRAAIEKMVRERWNNAYPKDKIIEIRIPQDQWLRRSEPGWRNGLLVMLQYSIVTPYVVVEEEGGLASLWGMVAEKDHLENDEITISFGRLREKNLDPRYVVLQSSL